MNEPMHEPSTAPAFAYPAAPLVEYLRHGLPECVIYGSVAWAHGTELLHSSGGRPTVFGRSTLKPFMVRALQAELAGCSGAERAIAVASHNGDPQHLQAVESLLPRAEERLQTPPSLPLQPREQKSREPRRLYHPCSGEHAAILRGLEQKGWPTEDYTSPRHPYFAAYLEVLRAALGAKWEPAAFAKDGCGLATPALPLPELAFLYAHLAATAAEDWIWSAMTEHPLLVGGPGRLDSAILSAGGGRVLAKEGADGLLTLAVQHEAYPRGLGIAVKIAHGWDPRATRYVARACLAGLGIELSNPAPLDRQYPRVNPAVLPPELRASLEGVSFDEGAPNRDRFSEKELP